MLPFYGLVVVIFLYVNNMIKIKKIASLINFAFIPLKHTIIAPFRFQNFRCFVNQSKFYRPQISV